MGMPCARPTVGQLSFTVWLNGKFHLPIESRAPQPVNRWLADPAEHLWLWRLGCGAVPTIDLCQTLLILSKVILGCPLHDSVWEEGVGDEEERPGHGGHSCRCSQRSSMGSG